MAETRYFKNASVTVNGLSCLSLALDLTGTGSSQTRTISAYYAGATVAVDVAKRAADGTETVLASKVAQVTVTDGESYVLRSADWNCPETVLQPTDSIVVRVYARLGTTWYLIGSSVFSTEQLGAAKLEASTWTVYYYLSFTGTTSPARCTIAFSYDGSYPSRIEGFSWSAPPVAVAKRMLGDALAWIVC